MTTHNISPRNKIYGHLVTREEELKAENARLRQRITGLLNEKIEDNLLRMQIAQANNLFNSIDRVRFLQSHNIILDDREGYKYGR